MKHKDLIDQLTETIKIGVEVGDTILTGRFKNKKTQVKSIGKDEHGMPTINGRKVVNFRIQDKEDVFVDEMAFTTGDGTIKGAPKVSKVKKMKKKGHSSVPYGSGYKKVKESKSIDESEVKTIHSLLQKFGNSSQDATNMIKKHYKKVAKKFRGQSPRDKTMAIIGISLLGEVSAVKGGKITKFITGHNLTMKGKKYKQIEFETIKVDNSTNRVFLKVLAPKKLFGMEIPVKFQTLRRGPFLKTDTSKKIKEAPRKPRKKGQRRNSPNHSDLYTDENPKGTIHGLKFATVKDATKSVSKIKSSGKSHAHKIQAAVAMEQRAREMGKSSQAAVYRKFINQMKKKTKQEESKMSLKLEELVGKPITEAQFDEAAGKKDACYHKVKARYDVWPSAYASGALVKCRKVGAANWGNKSKKEDVYYESITKNGITETHVYWESDGKPHGYTFAFVNELNEAEYQGRKVKLGKIMQGDTKKFKVYVKNPKGNVVKVNFGQGGGAKGGTMRIRKSNPKARANFRARHNCDNPGPRHKARYWSCRKW